MRLREAGAADAATIAALHVASWRDAYASILDPGFLAGPVEQDRLDLWQERLSNPRSGQRVSIAEQTEGSAGFICTFADDDPLWGARVDNLHVLPFARGRGIGTLLLRSAARWIASDFPGSSLHLWVFEANEPALRFYEHLGGRVVEEHPSDMPSARGAVALRVYWRDPASLGSPIRNSTAGRSRTLRE